MKPITQINKKAFIILIISAGCFGAILLLAMLPDFPDYPNGRHISPVAKVACGVSLMVFVLSLIYIVLDVFDIFIIQLIIKPIIRWIKKMVLSRLNMYNDVAVKQAENFSPEPENSDSITESQVPCDVLDSIGVPALDNENADKTSETTSSEQKNKGSIIENNVCGVGNYVINQMVFLSGQKNEFYNGNVGKTTETTSSPEPENKEFVMREQVPEGTPDGTGESALGDENVGKTTETSSSELEKTDNITEENDTNNNIVNDSNEIEEIKEDSEMQSNNLSSSETEEGMVGLQNDGDIVDNNEEEPEVVKEEDKQINGEGESNIDKKQKDFTTKYVIYRDKRKNNADEEIVEEENVGRKNVYNVIKRVIQVSVEDKDSVFIFVAAEKLGWISDIPSYADAVKFFGIENIERKSAYYRHLKDKNDNTDKIYAKQKSLKANMGDVVGLSNVYFNTMKE